MKKIVILLVLIGFFGCKGDKNTIDQSNLKLNNKKVSLLKPKSILIDNDLSLDIYDFNGLEPLLNKKDDKTYVVNFWATWCKPCIAELPGFEKLQEEYIDKNVEVILVSLDFPRMYKSHLIPFVKENKLKSSVVILDDPKQNDWIPKVDENWSGAIPATIIYNKNKRMFFEQSFNYIELETEVKQFIN